MLDGVDGLAGGAAAVALVWLMIIASFAGNSSMIAPMEIVLVGLCAFLLFNMRSPWRIRASVFLGDAGSMALGMTLAYFMLRIVTTSTVSFPALLWIVIVPIADTLSLMVRRTLAGRSPMSADRWHLHHLLIDGGLGKGEATNAILSASVLCGAVGFGLIYMQASYPVTLCSLLLPISIHTAFVMTTGTYDLKRMTTFLPPESTPIPLEQPDMTETIIQPASQTVSELEL
jgi:UDP-GlcNAc:undecaprenyl-phosphate GlcNAc-1-phosphate transferase